MSIALDSATEARIHEILALGHYASADDLINAALDSLAAEEAWSPEGKS